CAPSGASSRCWVEWISPGCAPLSGVSCRSQNLEVSGEACSVWQAVNPSARVINTAAPKRILVLAHIMRLLARRKAVRGCPVLCATTTDRFPGALVQWHIDTRRPGHG